MKCKNCAGGRNLKENAVRLQKYLADQGVCSRRRAEELIAAGRVQVNGARAELGQAVDPAQDRVSRWTGGARQASQAHLYHAVQAARGRDDHARRAGPPLCSGPAARHRRAGIPRRPAGPRFRGHAADDGRRRARKRADQPEVQSPQDLPGDGGRRACARRALRKWRPA